MENTIKEVNTEVEMSEEVSSFSLKVGIALAALIGCWGIACLVGGIASVGVVGLVKSFFIALAV